MLDSFNVFLKFGDGDGVGYGGPNLCRVKKSMFIVPHLLKLYFGLG